MNEFGWLIVLRGSNELGNVIEVACMTEVMAID